MRSSEALLVIPESSSTISSLEDKNEKAQNTISTSRQSRITKLSTDLLEVGDIVRVPPGASPPADGTVVSSETTYFDESSLTGESRDVPKSAGDQVFVGTINKLRVVDVRVEAVNEGTMYVDTVLLGLILTRLQVGAGH